MQFGLSYVGFWFLVLLMVPNLLWRRNQPKDYEKYVVNEKYLLWLERIGKVPAYIGTTGAKLDK